MTPFSLSQPESSMEELLMIHTKEMLFLQQGIRLCKEYGHILH
jgi:hypothetical protein